MEQIRFLVAGDRAMVVEFGKEISEDINKKVKVLYEALKVNKVDGIIETVPTFRSLLIYYDPVTITYKKLKKLIEKLHKLNTNTYANKKRILEVPVLYGEGFDLDMERVSSYTGLMKEEIIERHSSKDYLIYMLGFLPGFSYLGGLDTSLITPRLDNPRVKIPAGSVGIGGEQTGIYPLDSPGGWNIIGMTPIKLYDPNRAEPTLFKAGDYIRFKPITSDEYSYIKELEEKKEYNYSIIIGG